MSNFKSPVLQFKKKKKGKGLLCVSVPTIQGTEGQPTKGKNLGQCEDNTVEAKAEFTELSLVRLHSKEVAGTEQ